jgi:hypothetical protein
MVFLLNLMRFGFPLTIMIKYGDVNFIALENSLCTDMKFKDLVDEGGDNAAPQTAPALYAMITYHLIGSYRSFGVP